MPMTEKFTQLFMLRGVINGKAAALLEYSDMLTLSQSGHCLFKWISRGHFKPTPSATI